MTVTIQTPFTEYTAAPGSTVFATSFRLITPDDLIVLKNGVLITSGFIVTGFGQTATATVTFTTPMVGGEVIQLRRVIKLERLNNYQFEGDFQANVVNEDYDRLWMSQQDQELSINENEAAAAITNLRNLRAPVGEVLSEMPNAAARANKIQAFDSTGLNPIYVLPGTGTASDVLIQLANPSLGAGIVAYDPALTYPVLTVGSGISAAVATTTAAIAAAAARPYQYRNVITNGVNLLAQKFGGAPTSISLTRSYISADRIASKSSVNNKTNRSVSITAGIKYLMANATAVTALTDTDDLRMTASETSRLAGKNCTLSFDHLAFTNLSASTKTVQLYYCGTLDTFNTGMTLIATATATMTTTGKYVVNFLMPSAATLGLELRITHAGTSLGAAPIFGIGNMQLEEGTYSTTTVVPEYVEDSVNLARCQVFCTRVTVSEQGTSTQVLQQYNFPQIMRRIPDAPVVLVSGTVVNAVINLEAGNLDTEGFFHQITTTGAGYAISRKLLFSAGLDT